jgi:hypothetical protein
VTKAVQATAEAIDAIAGLYDEDVSTVLFLVDRLLTTLGT